MISPNNLQSFLAPLEALSRLIERFNNRGIIIGGIASSLLGKPRLTADLDALVLLSTENIPDVIQAAMEEGINPRIDGALEFARKNRILLLRHVESGTNIDISLGILPFEEEAIERGILIQVAHGVVLRLPTPEDLIILKAVAHRPKDYLDISAIIERYPKLDRGRIEYWVRQFAEVLKMPELWDDLSALL